MQGADCFCDHATLGFLRLVKLASGLWMGPDDGDQIADFFVITADVPQRCAIKKAIAVAMA
ncbi:hypothetical protein BJP22_03970 [Aeromonas veronii]|nr:hypothetical protein BJP22_03970 [Aeromonas veronii]